MKKNKTKFLYGIKVIAIGFVTITYAISLYYTGLHFLKPDILDYVNVVLIKSKPGFPMLLDKRDKAITPHLIKDKEHSSYIINAMTTILKEGDKVVFVGNGFGYIPLTIGNIVGKEGKVYGFIPNYQSYNLIRYSALINQMDQVILSDKLLFSDYDEFLVDQNIKNWQLYSILLKKDVNNEQDNKGYVFKESYKLDQILSFDSNIKLIYLDAGNSSIEIIKGAQRLIERSAEVSFLINWNIELLSKYSDIVVMIKDMETLGFEFWVISDDNKFTLTTADKLLKIKNEYILITREAF